MNDIQDFLLRETRLGIPALTLADGPLGYLGNKIFDDLIIHISFKQSKPHFSHGLGNIFLGQLAMAAQLLEDFIQSIR